MSRGSGLTILAVDLVGGITVAAFVLAFLWLTFVRSDGTAARVQNLTGAVETARQNLAQARTARDRLRVTLANRQDELLRAGRLPDQAPVEEYFQVLSRLATRHRVRVVLQSPLSSRCYPGLFEQRFAYEVTGSMLDLTRFLGDIERTDYWADVSFFTIDNGRDHMSGAGTQRAAALTVSLFSAATAQVADDKG